MQMIMLVLDDPSQLDTVIDGWRSVGVSGVTIIETIGAHRRETRRVRGRYLFGLRGLAETAERSQYTLFAIVPDLQTANRCLDATESIVGDLSEPDTGVFAVWELSMAKGVPDQLTELGADA